MMRAAPLALLTTLMLMNACATSPTPPPAAAGGECNAAQAQFAVGRQLDSQLRADAQQRAGAKTLRVYRSGDAITMDFSTQRLNLETDATGKVIKASCG